jgi:hypothetical protein
MGPLVLTMGRVKDGRLLFCRSGPSFVALVWHECEQGCSHSCRFFSHLG